MESAINGHIATFLGEYEAIAEGERQDAIDVDLTEPGCGWPEICQDIVRRSATLDEIVVTTAFICSKMRPDGFGGSVMRITAGTIQYTSTVEMLEDMMNAPLPSPVDASGHGTRSRIEAVAGAAGWDSSTLLLLISRWFDQSRQTETLIDFLDRLAADEED